MTQSCLTRAAKPLLNSPHCVCLFRPFVCPCASRKDIVLTFTTDLGDLPLITLSSSLSGTVILLAAETRKGDMENAVCSNRGLCNTLTGECHCHELYSSSDGSNAKGIRGDCGFESEYQLTEGYFTPLVAKTTT